MQFIGNDHFVFHDTDGNRIYAFRLEYARFSGDFADVSVARHLIACFFNKTTQ
jgi:hypothetical protein